MPDVPHLPDLRVVPLERIRPHEEIDPLRVERLAARIGREGTQLNPVACTEGPGGDMVLLDGATRTAALGSLGLRFGVVQVVDPATVILETWHHVVRDATTDEVVEAILARDGLEAGLDGAAPRIWQPTGERLAVSAEGLSDNETLTALVAGYIGHWKVSRVIDADPGSADASFPGWALLVEFPPLTIDDVIAAALSQDLLPAGITRFIVPDRALRLNYDLEELRGPGSEDERQAVLDRIIDDRAREGRIRRYEEPVFILDD